MKNHDKQQKSKRDSDAIYREVVENPVVRAVGGWYCQNHDDVINEATYVAKAKSDVKAFSKKIDEALALL